MKRIIYFLTLSSVLLLSACGDAQQNQTTNKTVLNEVKSQPSAVTEEKEKDQTIEVDKGLLSNEVTLPASMFNGQDLDQVIAAAKEKGVGEVTKNADGSLTYKMSKTVYNKMLKELKGTTIEYVESLKNGVDYTSIKDVTYNESFSEFTLIVDKEAYESSLDGMASLGLFFSASLYQLFEGVSNEKLKITVNVQDEKTKEIISTKDFPDELNK
ncbi:hypothetical protein I6N90_04660 [Paenibacillus sp. GSMTC-2017]|uniref:hypothetical protein n=1 Tax=Paenibacillus sp. GSMTC-2017 TaxID=2794350 RepID=UPI0018D5C953|nr:hypothetical protein [Paenibacillus sp. GSMTC-2017]MBH5317100.1 hypothetical protein [Paenibacillus sp. GSMTC-2017]